MHWLLTKLKFDFFFLSVDLATDCYEHACGKFPNNLELMMGLFNCYVREYSFVKQQQVCPLLVCTRVCVCVVFITSSFFCFLIGRQLLKCTSLLEKKGFFFGQFVASNYRFLFHPACCLPLSASYLVRHVWKCLLA